LIFDLGKVVVDFDPLRALRRLDGKSPFSAAEMLEKMKKAEAMARFEKGEISTLDFFHEITQWLELNISFEEFTFIWSDIFLPDLILDESFFAPLKPHYRLLALSNTNAMHTRHLRARFSVLNIFDKLILSFEVGAMKPDPPIYQAAMEAAGTSPDRIFYVDDLNENLKEARKLGWTAVLFTDKQQLEEDLRRHAILPIVSF
jgi:putative hydrolase of the HAD superfamily